MHRWFFADEEIIYKELTPTHTPAPETRTPSPSCAPDTEWKFTVKFKGQLCFNESLALSGSCDILGNWEVQQCVILKHIEDSSLWTITLMLPRKYDIRYRYLICATNGYGHRIVRFWETHPGGRLIRCLDEQELESMSYEVFGIMKGVRQVERGWISRDAMVVQFKFYKAPFTLKMAYLKDALSHLYVKVSPLRLKPRREQNPKLDCIAFKGTETVNGNADEVLRTTFSFCEVASCGQSGVADLQYQSKYGSACGPEEILLFHLTLGDVANTVYLIDLYTYSPKSAVDVPPYHFGYQYVLPQQLKNFEGTLKLNIMCATKHRPIGSVTFDYLLIKPLNDSPDFILKDTFQRHYKRRQQPLDIGHRGCGKSFWVKDNILRENTLNSFNKALEHGADMIEFDVLLTKDPIVYHDSQLYISRKDNLNNKEFDIMKLYLDEADINELKRYARVLKSGLICLPINKFTLKQLKSVQVYEIPEESPRSTTCREDNKLNLPFVSLEKVLQKLPLKLGFNIEIKWPQNNTDEQPSPHVDKNEYVDTILNTILKKARPRHIILSSVDADICTMIRWKQNRYPVMFICNVSRPRDARGDSLLSSSNFAQAMELLGVVADACDILESSGQISNMQERKIRIFAWSADTRAEKNRRSLKSLGVDGIIFDRINHILDVEDLKQNIVLIERKDKSLEEMTL